MFNMFNPQSMVTELDSKTKEYASTFLDTIEAFQVSSVKAFDQFTNNTFNIYTSKVIDTVKDMNVNAKEIIKSGKFKVVTATGHKE